MTKTKECPSCGTETLEEVFVRENFDIQLPQGKEKLLIRFPCLKCSVCAEKFPTPSSQKVIQQAIKEFLGKKLDTAFGEVKDIFEELEEKRAIVAARQLKAAKSVGLWLGIAIGWSSANSMNYIVDQNYWLGAFHLIFALFAVCLYIKFSK